MALGDRIREARKSAGLTQGQLASMVGIGKSTLSGYEHDGREPTMQILAKIMDVLGVDANFLLQDEARNQGSILTDDEVMLIENYRELSDENRQKALRLVTAMRDAQEIDGIIDKTKERLA